jgi:hypothetical protein
MTNEAMSPLRRRMIEDMTIRKLAPNTQQGYIRTINDFAAFLGRSPDTASFEDVRRFQLHLAANGAHVPILNHAVAALRFFFRVTLRRSDIIEHTTFIHEPSKLPVVLSPEESGAPAGCRAGSQIQGRAERGLRRRSARRRSDLAQGRRRRQQAHGHSRRARQRSQGPLRDAVATSARTAAGLVAGGTTARLAVSRTRPRAADDDAAEVFSLKVGEHAIAPLVPQAPDRVCEKLVMFMSRPPEAARYPIVPAATIYYNSLSRHLARNIPWLPPSRGCAMSSRNASAMRSLGVSASKARTNLPSGSMT